MRNCKKDEKRHRLQRLWVVKVKVKVRIQANNQAEAAKARTLLLKRCPELILANPRKGSNPKYAGQQKWACYGDFEFGAVRKRRS